MTVGAGMMSRWTPDHREPRLDCEFYLELGPASGLRDPLVAAQTLPGISDAPPRAACAKGATSFRTVPRLVGLASKRRTELQRDGGDCQSRDSTGRGLGSTGEEGGCHTDLKRTSRTKIWKKINAQ
ncbi:hypothetical protein PG984_013803 [Apiospora sp. TS-2023a]